MSRNKENFDARARANEYVNWVEEDWMKKKWQEYGVYTSCEDGDQIADNTLDDISVEQDRLDVNSDNAIDQE